MNEPSPESLKAAVQALYQVRAVEGPPGDDGQRAIWHLCARGAELLSFVDKQDRVRRQEFTLLDEHCVWTSDGGLRTGRVERGRVAAAVHEDPTVVPDRLLRAALALASYRGEDRYLLHMQRVLSLAREGIEMKRRDLVPRVAELPVAPPVAPPLPEPPSPSAPPAPPEPLHESGGLLLPAALGLALVLCLALLLWLTR